MTVLNLDQILEKIEGLNSNLHLLEQMEITNERAAQKKKEEILNKTAYRIEDYNSRLQSMRGALEQRFEEIIGNTSHLLHDIDTRIKSIKSWSLKRAYVKSQEQPEPQNLNTLDQCERALSTFKMRADDVEYGPGSVSVFHSEKEIKLRAYTELQQELVLFGDQMFQNRQQILVNSLNEYRNHFQREIEEKEQTRSRELARLSDEEKDRKERLYDSIEKNLEMRFPSQWMEELVKFHEELMPGIAKINTSQKKLGGLENAFSLFYNISWIKGQRIKGIVEKKFEQFLVDERKQLAFFYGMSESGKSSCIVQTDKAYQEQAVKFFNNLILSALFCVPVGNLEFTVIDPVKKGTSISAFYTLKQKNKKLFGEKIYTEAIEISEKIRGFSDRVTRNQQENTETGANGTEILLLYDFSREKYKEVLPHLANIAENGGKCGIHIWGLASANHENAPDNRKSEDFDLFMSLSKVIVQKETLFSIFPCYCFPFMFMETESAKKLIDQYLLYLNNINGQSNGFPSLLQTVVFSKKQEEANAAASRLYYLRNMYGSETQIQESIKEFPQELVVGMVSYPASIFETSAANKELLAALGGACGDGRLSQRIELPLTLDMKKGFDLYLECPTENREKILGLTHAVIWKFLSSLPVGKGNVCIFDGKQRGNSIIPFLEFKQRCPEAFDEKIYTSQEDMYERLRVMNRHIDEFIQEKLGNRFPDFWEYNKNTPNRSEAATLLVLYDFPNGMDKRNLELLQNVIQNGRRCGIYTLICHNPEVAFSGYENIEFYMKEIREECETMEYRGSQLFVVSFESPAEVMKLPSDEVIENFISSYIKKLEKIKKKGISFADILPEDLFQTNSAGKLSIPVGIGDRDAVVNLVMGEGSSHHGLIAGATGSGKSTLLHTIIMSSMMNYSPDQLQLYLMDFKSGTEFKIYESERLPHIRLLALDAMQEFGESILENLVEEMEHRAELFKEEAGGVTSVKDYVRITGNSMPRLLVIIDEFQILFNDAANRKVAEHCSELAKRIVTEGRAFGIHLLMATQSMRGLSNMTLISGIVEQMLIRVGLKCGESDIRYLFGSEDYGKIQTMMKGPLGTAVMNLDYTEKPNTGFRVAYLDDDTQKEYLKKISSRFSDYPSELQIFEGKRREDLLDHFKKEGMGLTEEFPAHILVGEPIKVAPPYEIVVDKKRKHNLLVCGSDVKMTRRIINNYMISALMNKNVSVYCADGDILVDDESAKPFYDMLGEWSGRFTLALDRGEIIQMIDQLYKEYLERKKKNKKDQIFVVFRNLQFLDIVEMMMKGEKVERGDYLEEEPASLENEFSSPMDAFNFDMNFSAPVSEDTMQVGDKLMKLIETGGMYGISFVVSSLEFQTIKDSMFSYGNNAAKNFPERIVFSLSQNDAEYLLDDVSVSGLGDNTVYFTDGIREKMQIKPYLTPDLEQLRDYLDKLQ